ncbi:putative MFS multidrug transporter [Zalerion maritima]|uniref:MFS multidrug transporter n=1 Tax=Zalerion maritima TaxID=339359 RepID=A0AAD5WSQ3_9PEZI|nr:putative MFS multidrug transporter [Zalerion maritima]
MPSSFKRERASSIEPSESKVQEDNMGDTSSSSGTNGTMPRSRYTHQDQAQPSTTYPAGFRLVAILGSVTLVCFLMLLDSSIVSTAAPKITDYFHSLNDVGWYGSAYTLSIASLQPLSGKIYNRVSIKWAFLSFFFVFELGSLICGVATSSTMLIVGRAVAGMGASGLMNGGMSIVAGSVTLSRRPAIIGMVLGVGNIAIAAGPLLGGVFTEYASWRWCFYVNLPIGGVVAVMMLFVDVPELVENKARLRRAGSANPSRLASVADTLKKLPNELDLVGFALIAPAAIQLLLALQYGGNDFPWNSSTVIGLFCGSGATFAVWLFWNYRRGDDALIPVSMARKRPVWVNCLGYLFLMATLFVPAYMLPIYFQAVKDATPFQSGVDVLPTILSQLFATVISGFAVQKTGYPIYFALTSGTLVTVGCGLLSTLSSSTPTGEWVGYQIIAGVGRGLGLQMAMIAIQAALPPSEIPTGTALLIFSQSMGTSIFLTVANTILNQSLSSQLHTHAPDVDADAILAGGATAFREFVDEEDLPGVLTAYANSVGRTFYLTVGAGAAAFCFGWGMGFLDIREKKKDVPRDQDQDRDIEKIAV